METSPPHADRFPESIWGQEDSGLRKVMLRLVGSRPMAFLARKLVPVDRMILRRTQGRRTALGPLGVPMLVLSTIGRKTGQVREQPLVYVRDGDRLVVAGTNFGQSHHPAWTTNLLANPHVDVTVGGHTVPAVAIPLMGTDRERWLGAFAEFGDNYGKYVARAGREIRVFALQRTSEWPAGASS